MSPWGSIAIKNLYLSDNQSDTLAFVEQISARISAINLKKKRLRVSNMQIKKPFVKLISHNDSSLNLLAVIDSFKKHFSADPSDHASWDISFHNSKVKEGRFAYKNFYRRFPATNGMDYDDLKYYNINSQIPTITIANDTVSLLYDKFSCKEKCGFTVKNITTKMLVAHSFLKFKEAKINTSHSYIEAPHLTFSYVQGKHQWRKFTRKVKIDYLIKKSVLDFGELTLLNEHFSGYQDKANFSGQLTGTIQNLKCKQVEVKIFNHTSFSGDIYFNGLPRMKSTYFDAKIKDLQTKAKDLENIYIPSLKSNYFSIPKKLAMLGKITYRGYFKGFFPEFISKGRLNSALGYARVNLKSTLWLKENMTKLSGNIETTNFLAGKFLGDNSLKIIKGNTQINGQFGEGETSCTLRSDIQQLAYKNSFFKDVTLTANISDNLVKSTLTSKDNKLDLSGEVVIRLNEKHTAVEFTSRVAHANLQLLRVVKEDRVILRSNVSGKLKLYEDDVLGNIDFTNLTLQNKNDKLSVPTLRLLATRSGEHKLYKINSPVADAFIRGNLKHTELPDLFGIRFNPYLDFSSLQPYDFSFQVHLKKSAPILNFLSEDITLADNSTISGHYYANGLKADMHIPKLEYKKQHLTDLYVQVEKSNPHPLATIQLSSKELQLNDKLQFEGFAMKSVVEDKRINLQTSWNRGNKKQTVSTIVFADKDKTTQDYSYNILIPKQAVQFNESDFNIGESTISIKDKNITFNHTTIGNKQSLLKVHGKLSTTPSDVLTLQFTNSPLELLSTLLGLSTTKIRGNFNGDIRVSDFYNNRYALLNLQFNDIHINNENFGNVSLKSTWDNKLHKMFFASSIENIMDIKGSYDPQNKGLAADIDIQRLGLKLLSPYLTEHLYNPSGYVKGRLKMLGKISSPLLNGHLKFQNATIGVNQTRSEYVLSDELDITNNRIVFNDFKIMDKSSQEALLSGEIILNDWQNPLINLELITDKLNILNIQSNNLVYGKADISGKMKVKGTPNSLDLQANLTTNEDSKIGIDLGRKFDNTDDNFISFLKPQTSILKANPAPIEKSFTTTQRFNSKLTIPSDTDIELNFTSQIGNVLQTNGNGVLNFSNDDKGNLLINGQYKVESGNYQFSLLNLVNRKFAIQEGSFIQWSGNPYAAVLDIKAVYKVRTSIANLLENTIKDFENKTTVLCVLHMTDKIENPTLNFEIKFPNVDIQQAEILAAAFPTAEELNKQIISLLLFNRFYTPEFYDTDKNKNFNEDALKTTANFFVNNYLNKFISKLNEDIDIGLNYQSGDEIHNEEVGIALSTHLFNNRVILNTNLNWETQNEIQNQNSEGFAGDFDINLKIDKKGKFLFKAFTREDDNLYYFENTKNTQGVSIAFQDEFDTFKELIGKYVKFLGKKKE